MYIPGRMGDATKESGRTIKCTVKGFLLGQTVKYTMGSTLMIKKKVTENLNGPTGKYIKEVGKTGYLYNFNNLEITWRGKYNNK